MRNERTMHALAGQLLLAACAMVVAAGQELVKIMSAEQMTILHLAMDRDGDGSLTMDEGRVFLQELSLESNRMQSIQIMQSMDTNTDGFLSLDELKEDLKHWKIDTERKSHFANSFSSFDDNGDGQLSLDEALPLFNFMFPFQKLDADKDGLLSLEEFKQVSQAKLEKAREADEALWQQEIQKSHEEGKQHFVALDSDGDGKINAKEMFVYQSGLYASLTAWKALFQMADADGDGQVSAEDFVAVRENPQFGGSAAYHHSKEWIRRIEEVVKQAQAQARGGKSGEL